MNDKIEVPTMQVPPLKRICMTIGQLPTSYLETMSYYEMLVWFVNYLRDDIIPVVNANGEATQELQELFVELQNYVNNYFDDLNIQNEVDDKLNRMVEDGTLDEIINQEIFGEINNTLDSYKSFEKEQTLYLAPFFDKDSQPDNYLYASVNGKSFSRLGNTPWVTARDGDIIFYNNKFYALTTETNEDLSIADLYVSEDLEHWERKSLYIDFEQPSTYRNYPCNWFIDDNEDIYLSGAYQVGTMVDSVSGVTYRDFRLYIVKVLDMNFDTFTLDEPIILSSLNYNLIDSHIVKKDDVYYMFAKKECNDGTFVGGTIQTFTSLDLTNWNRISNTISSLGSFHYEAPSIVKIDNTYYMYLDNYSGDNGGFMQYITSDDLMTWSAPSPLQSKGFPTRHGTIRKINGIGQKIISSYSNTQNQDYINGTRKNIVLPQLNSASNNKYIELATIFLHSNYTSFKLSFNLKDIENNLFDSDVVIDVKKTTTYTISFEEHYKKYFNRNKLALIKIDDNTFKLYFNTLTITACHPCITIKEIIGTRVSIDFNEDYKLINSLPTGTSYIPNIMPLNVSTSDAFRVETINTGASETSITAKFNRLASYPSFSCIILGRNNCVLFQAQINASGNLTDYHAYDLTPQNKSYTLTTDDTNHTITLSGLNAYNDYVLLINDITYGDIEFYK